MIEQPLNTEYIPYFDLYISLVKDDPLTVLTEQQNEVIGWLKNYPVEKLDLGYAVGKWSPKDLIQHIIDTERIFCFRALSFARGDQQVFPGFNENDYADAVITKAKTLEGLCHEYRSQRESTLAIFKSFTTDELKIIGNTSGGKMSVRALLYILAGHDLHHFNVLRDRY